MSNKNLKGDKKASGFTIIEVLIVLAIAGLILLIVFLAVPALQRNARNTSMKTDVQNTLGGISEFQGANSGKLPTSVSAAAGSGKVDYTGVTGTNATSINVQGTTAVTTQGTGNPTSATVPTTGAGPTNGTINIYIGKRCDNTVSGRAVAAVYSIESSSSTTVLQCQDS